MGFLISEVSTIKNNFQFATKIISGFMLLWIIFNVAEFTKRNPITVILLKLDMFSILILSIADTKSKFGFFTLYVTSHTRDAFHYPIILGFLRSDILTIRTPSVRSAIKIMLGSEMLCIIELA